MRLEMPRLKLDCAAQVIQSVFHASALCAAQTGAQAKRDVGVVRRQRESGLQAGNRFIVSAGIVEHRAERIMGSKELRVESRGALEKRDAWREVAPLLERQPELNMGHCMARDESNDPTKAVHGIVEAR